MAFDDGRFIRAFLRNLTEARPKRREIALQFLQVFVAEVERQLDVCLVVVLDIQFLPDALFKFVQQGVHVRDL